jgi:hypothetical protein
LFIYQEKKKSDIHKQTLTFEKYDIYDGSDKHHTGFFLVSIVRMKEKNKRLFS